jgi:glycosyltransferase involved in cell wall biosynthesis
LSAAARTALSRIEARLHEQTLARAASLVVTGDPARRALPKPLHDRCIEAPYGVDTAMFAATPLPPDPVILFFSVLLPRKGIHTLLRALPIVRERIPRATLLVAGADPRGLMPSLRREAADLGIEHAVTWLGEIGPADAPPVFAQARVFCQPSDGEPFGMTILEAMSSARPVVATNAGGVPGFVRDGVNGRLVPPGQERMLADALVRVLIDPAKATEIGERNRRDAVERFDWERVVDRIEEAYERAVRGKSEDVTRLAG